ncbi:hypothetical protein V2J09_017423 [Rumex salicifolius]
MLALAPHRLALTLSSQFRFPPNFFSFTGTRSIAAVCCSGERQLLVRSPELVASEYADLNLTYEPHENAGQLRIRQHVNPLSSSFTVPADIPDWKAVFRDSTLPLVVDIGSGSGRFLLWLANKNSSKNYLGLEIRQKLVRRANIWANDLSLCNTHFLFANATVSFQKLVASYPGPLVLVSILCPDPHFKRKHKKRRVVQSNLVDSIVHNLASSGQVFLQSDVLEVALDMRYQFDTFPGELQHIDAVNQTMLCDCDGWLLQNPMGIRTEREIHAEFEGLKIYRRLYQKIPL